jgi:magnesium transporter
MTERGYELLQGTVERLLRRNATVSLIKILNKSHPADIAYLLKLLSERHARTIFELLPDIETAGDVLSEMEEGFRPTFLQTLDVDRLVEILSAMPGDDTAAVMADLPEPLREQVLTKMTDEETEEVSELLSYPEETAGRIMTTEFLALPETMTAREAIQAIRSAQEAETVFYLYVLDEEKRLAGVLSLRQLVTMADDETLDRQMTSDVVKVHTTTDQEEAARLVSRYNLLALPVVDHEEVLVGIITVDDVIDVLRYEATEDILKMAGTSEEEISSFSVMRSVKVRLPWLFASWVGGVFAMKVIAAFEDQIIAVAALAAFIPVIMGMGGNIGTQSSTIAVRGLATGRIDPSSIWRLIWKEARVGLLLGVAYGILLAIVGWYLYDNTMLGIAVGLAICANMTMAAFVGTFLPMIFEKFHIDPAVASGPFVTTSIDIIGVSLYFLVASLLLF